MDMTTLLASLWGPIILAVGIGIFTSPKYYKRIYRDLEESALAMLVFGMVAMGIGIWQVQVHNVWNTLPEVIVSLLGWAVLAKGAAFILAPNFVDNAGDRWANLKLIPFAGTAAVILGGYLSYLAYFA